MYCIKIFFVHLRIKSFTFYGIKTSRIFLHLAGAIMEHFLDRDIHSILSKPIKPQLVIQVSIYYMIYFSSLFFGDQTQVGTPYVDTIVCLFFLDQQQPGASSSVTYFWQVYSSKERMMESLHYSNDILFSKNFCLSAFLLQCFLDVQRLAEDYHRFDLQYTHCLHVYENVSSMYYLVLLEVEKRLPKKLFIY